MGLLGNVGCFPLQGRGEDRHEYEDRRIYRDTEAFGSDNETEPEENGSAEM